ncbi:alpha/beta hydrolase [Nonomuraea sp. MG754425]|nr:alpha/beta hydrolase [Nonomuraea sp. MG754425]
MRRPERPSHLRTGRVAGVAELAAAGCRAVAFDQRGYSPGARPAEVAAYRMPHLVQDVLDVADTLGADRFHLVGHDWGGSVAWCTAFANPARAEPPCRNTELPMRREVIEFARKSTSRPIRCGRPRSAGIRGRKRGSPSRDADRSNRGCLAIPSMRTGAKLRRLMRYTRASAVRDESWFSRRRGRVPPGRRGRPPARGRAVAASSGSARCRSSRSRGR